MAVTCGNSVNPERGYQQKKSVVAKLTPSSVSAFRCWTSLEVIRETYHPRNARDSLIPGPKGRHRLQVVQDGVLSKVKLGGALRFDVNVLDRFIEQHSTKAIDY